MEDRNIIKGKKVLAFVEFFFGYENAIVEIMRSMGALVDVYNERSVTAAFDRALLKISPNIFGRRSKRYYENIIVNLRENYDYILFLQCDMVPESILETIRDHYPNAKMCLYLWDSVENLPNINKKFRYFDKCSSFDSNDCKKYLELNFRPLFFSDEFRMKNEPKEYRFDISFLGTIHSDRYAIIKKVQQICNEQGLNSYWFLYLQSHFIYYYYKVVKPEFWTASIDVFSFDKMKATDVASVVNESKVVLDIQHPKQTGLTMRTIEMIGMNKKIVTTNETIRDYDFYNPNNVYVIGRNNPYIDSNFFTSDYEPLSDEIYEKYGIRKWILDVLID